MATATLSPARAFVRLSFAGVKRARSLFRSAGISEEYADWAGRASICARCPLAVSAGPCGKLHCGKPLLRQIERDEPTQGCGCPVAAKAKDPAEHCPRTPRFLASSKSGAATCDCVWCVAARADAARADAAGTGPKARDGRGGSTV